jgi:hypothetical protein
LRVTELSEKSDEIDQIHQFIGLTMAGRGVEDWRRRDEHPDVTATPAFDQPVAGVAFLL